MRSAGRRAGWVVAGLAAGAAAATLAVTVTPRPLVALIKILFDRGGNTVATRMLVHVPHGVGTRVDIAYRADDADAVLSVHRVGRSSRPLPVVVWVHGGGWVSGRNAHVDPYLAILAARCATVDGPGVVTVGVDYTHGPFGVYPTAIEQICDALGYLAEHADELGLDLDRVVLAGDSAGAQLVSQIAAMVTDPGFADQVGRRPPLGTDQLRGIMLHCGVYDLTMLRGAPAPIGWAVSQVLWAYTGARPSATSAALEQMSSIDRVTAAFPPTLITAGNADPLTATQSVPFAARLAELGVDVETHFYPDDHTPPLGHEFQFDLDNADGRHVLDRTVAFVVDRLAAR